jgi:Zn-dependent peptidase ImmA (M78 family)/DNA-binding XRE family transcriptional regulator
MIFNMINGNRIRQARVMRGLTQTKLATEIEVKQSAISQMESGEMSPSNEIMQKIVLKTGFPLLFFQQPDSPEFSKGSMLFRARASLTKKESEEVEQYTSIVFEFAEKLEVNFKTIPLNLPKVDSDPINAAIETRSFWGLSKGEPIENLISILEANGVTVLALPVCYEKEDALSAWMIRANNKRPVVAISNDNVSGDRLRFSMAHELGHLLLHQTSNIEKSKADKEANLFAGEFLMPKESILKEFSLPITFSNLLSAKRRWRVSIQAIIRQFYNHKIITERQYRYLMMQWHRKTEPIEIIAEKPRLLSQMIEHIYGDTIDYKKIAPQMNLPIDIVKNTLEKYYTKAKINNEEVSCEKGKIFYFTNKNNPS